MGVPSDVGLGNVDNTSDVNKPVSTAQAAALALKVDKVNFSSFGTGLVGVTNQATALTYLGIGNSFLLSAPTSGNAGPTQLVIGTDTRLTDARTPVAHSQAWSTITGTPTTAAGYGITDVASSSTLNLKVDKSSLSAFGSTFVTYTDAPTARTGLGLGTVATLAIPSTGNASTSQVVIGTDTRLSDARTPTAHNQAWSTISSTPTTLAGYGILDGATTTLVNTGLALKTNVTDLSSTTSLLNGAGLVGYNGTFAYTGGVGLKLKDWVSPSDYPWLADRTGTADSVTAFNSCYAWCKANNKKMRILNGTYSIGSTPNTFECPRDDGSYSPSIGSGETTLAPETAVNLSASLIFDGAVEIEGESFDNTVLQGNWAYASSAINSSQSVGIVFGASKDGYTTLRIRNLTLRNFFIPYVVQGALSRSNVEIKVDGAAFAGLIQSAEGLTGFSIQMVRCYAGTVIGGWWLQRNRTVGANNMPSSFGASYPASDIFRGCWGENIKFNRVEWTAQPIFDSRADSVDTFFNTYFFKSSNSAVYPAGRATVNADSSFTSGSGYPVYRGVFGIAAAVITRNGRYSSAMKFEEFVSSGNSRPGIYINAGSQIGVRQFYCENSGLVNPNGGTSSNTMGVARIDPYHTGAPVTLGLWLENEGGSGTYLEEHSAANTAPGVPLYDPARTYNVQIPQRSSAVQQFLNGSQLGPDGSPTFTWTSPTFTPGISVGSTSQTGLNVDRALCYKAGPVYMFSLQLSKATLTISGTGNVTVTGLPVAAANGGWVTVSYFSMLTNTTLQLSGFLTGTTIELHKGTSRASPLTQADLTNGALVLTVAGAIFNI